MYTVTLNELKAVSSQSNHSVTANKTLSAPTAQNEAFREETQEAKL
jgi:hypothetical protein